MNIASMKYLIGYRDALDSLYAELNQGYASYWTEEQYETNKWLLEKVQQKATAVGQLVTDADRTQDRLDRRRK